jgi:hypothetical protein
MWSIIGIAAVGVMWINAEPTTRLRSLYKNNDWFSRLINCCLCSTFWISIFYNLLWYQSLDLFAASLSAIIAEFICRKLNQGSI